MFSGYILKRHAELGPPSMQKVYSILLGTLLLDYETEEDAKTSMSPKLISEVVGISEWDGQSRSSQVPNGLLLVTHTGLQYYMSALSTRDRSEWLLHVKRSLEVAFANDKIKDFKPLKVIQTRPKSHTTSKLCSKTKTPLQPNSTCYCRSCGRSYCSNEYISDMSTMLQIGAEEAEKCCFDCKISQMCVIWLKCINYSHLLTLHELTQKISEDCFDLSVSKNFKATFKIRRRMSKSLDMAAQLFEQNSINAEEFYDLQKLDQNAKFDKMYESAQELSVALEAIGDDMQMIISFLLKPSTIQSGGGRVAYYEVITKILKIADTEPELIEFYLPQFLQVHLLEAAQKSDTSYYKVDLLQQAILVLAQKYQPLAVKITWLLVASLTDYYEKKITQNQFAACACLILQLELAVSGIISSIADVHSCRVLAKIIKPANHQKQELGCELGGLFLIRRKLQESYDEEGRLRKSRIKEMPSAAAATSASPNKDDDTAAIACLNRSDSNLSIQQPKEYSLVATSTGAVSGQETAAAGLVTNHFSHTKSCLELLAQLGVGSKSSSQSQGDQALTTTAAEKKPIKQHILQSLRNYASDLTNPIRNTDSNNLTTANTLSLTDKDKESTVSTCSVVSDDEDPGIKFNQQIDFVEKVSHYVDSLRHVDRQQRTEALQKELHKWNENYKDLGWDPCVSAGEPAYRIVRLITEDCRVFRTKARAPSLIVCEVVRQDMDKPEYVNCWLGSDPKQGYLSPAKKSLPPNSPGGHKSPIGTPIPRMTTLADTAVTVNRDSLGQFGSPTDDNEDALIHHQIAVTRARRGSIAATVNASAVLGTLSAHSITSLEAMDSPSSPKENPRDVGIEDVSGLIDSSISKAIADIHKAQQEAAAAESSSSSSRTEDHPPVKSLTTDSLDQGSDYMAHRHNSMLESEASSKYSEITATGRQELTIETHHESLLYVNTGPSSSTKSDYSPIRSNGSNPNSGIPDYLNTARLSQTQQQRVKMKRRQSKSDGSGHGGGDEFKSIMNETLERLKSSKFSVSSSTGFGTPTRIKITSNPSSRPVSKSSSSLMMMQLQQNADDNAQLFHPTPQTNNHNNSSFFHYGSNISSRSATPAIPTNLSPPPPPSAVMPASTSSNPQAHQQTRHAGTGMEAIDTIYDLGEMILTAPSKIIHRRNVSTTSLASVDNSNSSTSSIGSVDGDKIRRNLSRSTDVPRPTATAGVNAGGAAGGSLHREKESTLRAGLTSLFMTSQPNVNTTTNNNSNNSVKDGIVSIQSGSASSVSSGKQKTSKEVSFGSPHPTSNTATLNATQQAQQRPSPPHVTAVAAEVSPSSSANAAAVPKRKQAISLLPVNRKSTNLLTMLIPSSSGQSLTAMADSLILGSNSSSNSNNASSSHRSGTVSPAAMSSHNSGSGSGVTGADNNFNLGMNLSSTSTNQLALSKATTILTQISNEDAGYEADDLAEDDETTRKNQVIENANNLLAQNLITQAEYDLLVRSDDKYRNESLRNGAEITNNKVESSFGESWKAKKERILGVRYDENADSGDSSALLTSVMKDNHDSSSGNDGGSSLSASNPKKDYQDFFWPVWDLRCFIIKSNDDLRQEVCCLQLMKLCKEIFDDFGLSSQLWLKPYRIVSTSSNTGVVQVLTNTMSLDALKKTPGFTTLPNYFKSTYGASGSTYLSIARKNFAASLAAYSLFTYILFIKDRHNGNILIDTEGHIIHIDFGFMLSIAPGGYLSLETAPFKLTEEMVEVLGGLDSKMFGEFVKAFTAGFLALRANAESLISNLQVVAMNSPYPCFHGKDVNTILEKFRSRFRTELSVNDAVHHCLDLIIASYGHYGTKQYDSFQYYTNGIVS